MNLIKMDGFFHPSQVKGAVHIIGCGAVGSSIAFILAHCGVTNFVLYDDDTVESHNIANQMFREKDIGRPKVEALRDILVEINPEIADEIRIVNGKYVDQPLSGYVFLCVDSVAVRKAVAQSQQYNPEILTLSDVRLGLTDSQHYLVNWRDPKEIRRFLKTMNFTDEDAKALTPHTACNVMLSVCTSVFAICSLAVSNWMRFIRTEGKDKKSTVLLDVDTMMLSAF